MTQQPSHAALEFDDRILAIGFDGAADDDALVFARPLHLAKRITDAPHLPMLPLCWVADGARRGATAEEWEISFDHEALPEHRLTTDRALVSCPDCQEQIHA